MRFYLYSLQEMLESGEYSNFELYLKHDYKYTVTIIDMHNYRNIQEYNYTFNAGMQF